MTAIFVSGNALTHEAEGDLQAIALTYLIASSIANPIKKLEAKAQVIANLDITENIDQKLLKNRDEVGRLARSFQQIIDSLRDTINEVMKASEQVASSSE